MGKRQGHIKPKDSPECGGIHATIHESRAFAHAPTAGSNGTDGTAYGTTDGTAAAYIIDNLDIHYVIFFAGGFSDYIFLIRARGSEPRGATR